MKDLSERSTNPPAPAEQDINLHDPVWNWHDGDSLDALVKACLRFYTQYASELGAKGPGDAKLLDKLVGRLQMKRVPEDVIEKVVFRMRLRDKQDQAKDAKKTSAKMKVSELREAIRCVLREATSNTDAFQQLLVRVKAGETDVEETIDGHHVRLYHDVASNVWNGTVDHGVFGQGKTPKSALSGIRRRLAFLTTNSGVAKASDFRERQAKADFDELERRRKRDV